MERSKRTKTGNARARLQSLSVALVLLANAPSGAPAADLAVSTEETVRLGGSIWSDHQVLGRIAPSTYGNEVAALTAALPAGTDLDALDYVSSSRVYFSLSEDMRLGGSVYADEDVILWNGSTFSLAWDGSAAGLPARCNLDALDVMGEAPLVFSFSLDESVRLIGLGLVEDEDLARWDGSAFSAVLDLDGSARGVPARADLESFNRYSANHWLMTFDTKGNFGTVAATPQDIASFSSGTGSFTGLFFEGQAAGFPVNASLDALEATPGQVPVDLSRFSLE